MCVDLDPLAFIHHFVSQLCVASKLVCSLREAMAGSLSLAITAVVSAMVADVVSGKIGRSVVNSK
jgi:phosphatidylserine synthase